MRKISIILLLFLCFIGRAQEKYALIIGIGDYPTNSGWNKIHGDNDVPLIQKYLESQDFQPSNIFSLVNSQATCATIKGQLEKIYSKVGLGDVVYIHFSGHGQQVTDLNGDEDDGYDEAWVPFDAKKAYEREVYEGENHIIDDYLNSYLSRLRLKLGAKGKIIVISDACHSGTGSRGFDGEDFVRGTNEKFEIPASVPNIKQKEQPVEWLFVAACKSYQTNHEFKSSDGNYYGPLSFSVANEGKNPYLEEYSEMVASWNKFVSEVSFYPQSLDNEGRPSKKSNKLF